MKTNGQMERSNSPGLKKECHTSWAHYFAKWVTAYQDQGVPIWAVTVQNEPENNAAWEACLYTAQETAEFVGSDLGPVLKAAHPDIKIFAFDHNKDHVYSWTKTMYANASVSKWLDGVAFHW